MYSVKTALALTYLICINNCIVPLQRTKHTISICYIYHYACSTEGIFLLNFQIFRSECFKFIKILMKCNELRKLTNDFTGIKWLNLRSSEAKMPQK